MRNYKILICDHVGLSFDAAGKPNASAVAAHISASGGNFHISADTSKAKTIGLHFFYAPELSRAEELLNATGDGKFDAVIAAATFIPPACIFAEGGVRIGTGTGNMQSQSWGGPNGMGGDAPLMNTPGFNARATAQMAFKALLRVRPDLPVAALHHRVVTGTFDTGKHLADFPTAKLEGQTIAIFGFGNIGRELAKLSKAFGMQVKIFAREHHRNRIEAEGFIYAATAAAAASHADVLSIHIGLGTFNENSQRFSNQDFISSEILSALNHHAVLLNYDRGECVDVAALDAAMASGQVAHAAIDADIFMSADGTLRGPMVPYLPLNEKYPNRLELLPHAAADTDHPSRVAGSIQAVNQIFEAIVNKRVINLKGDLPMGYSNGGTKLGV